MSGKPDAELRIHSFSWDSANNRIISVDGFDILPNIPGQRYTFGREYQGKKEGEEFIICPFPFVEPTHCAITVDDRGEFWIQSLSDIGDTFVNSIKLERRETKRLRFGDRLGFGGPTINDDGVFLELFPVFDFLEIGATRSQENHNIVGLNEGSPFAESFSKVGGNDLIIREILKYFSLPQLLHSRFVSKSWNSVAIPLLRKRTKLDITKQTTGSPSYKNQTIFFRLERLKGGLTPSCLSLPIPAKRYVWERINETVEAKFADDVLHFLGKTNSFESLQLFFQNQEPTEKDYKLAENVIEKVSKDLKELELNFSQYLLPIPGRYISELNFPLLTSVSFGNVHRRGLEALQSLTITLKTLKLWNIMQSDFQGVERVLEIHSRGLKHLRIGCCEGGLLNIPVLKMLQVLEFYLRPDTVLTFASLEYAVYSIHFPVLETLELEIERVAELAKMWLGLDNDLIVSEWYEECHSVFEALFKGRSQVCETVREVMLPHFRNVRATDTKYVEKIEQVSAMFPNLKTILTIEQ